MKLQRRELLRVLTAAAGSALLPGAIAAAEQTPAAEQTHIPNNLPKERVTGIGGVFFRARERVVRGDADNTKRSIGVEIANLEIGHESSSSVFWNLIENDSNLALPRFMCGHIRADMMEVARISS